MLTHCVLFRWNAGVDDATRATVSAALDELADLDCSAHYTHGSDAGLNDDNWDYAVVGRFATREDYAAYASDERHLQIIRELIAPNIEARSAVQFETTDDQPVDG